MQLRITLFLSTLATTVLAYDSLKMLCLVNKERQKAGLKSLGIDSRLERSAQAHSDDQAHMGSMTHDGSDGSSPGSRVSAAGYNWKAVAENVAYGYGDEESCMMQWMNSPGHRENILGPYTHFGSAAAYAGSTPYYTQDFGSNGQGGSFPLCPSSKGDTGDAGDDNSDYNGGGGGGGADNEDTSDGGSYGGGGGDEGGDYQGGESDDNSPSMPSHSPSQGHTSPSSGHQRHRQGSGHNHQHQQHQPQQQQQQQQGGQYDQHQSRSNHAGQRRSVNKHRQHNNNDDDDNQSGYPVHGNHGNQHSGGQNTHHHFGNDQNGGDVYKSVQQGDGFKRTIIKKSQHITMGGDGDQHQGHHGY
jgi:hypothetical protein